MLKHIDQELTKLKNKIDEVKSDLDRTDGMITANQDRLKQSYKLNSVKAAKDMIEQLKKREGEITTAAEAQFKELQKEVDFES